MPKYDATDALVAQIKELSEKRKRAVEVLEENSSIDLGIFTDFYPDKAHFIYELLQNCEDVGATRVDIDLARDKCVFAHNGTRQFDYQDIDAITGFNSSTKAKDPDKIGKFGIGFKSVFAHTDKPIIRTKKISFEIREMILPILVEQTPVTDGKTIFEFPFKGTSAEKAASFEEIKSGLSDLNENTLLFLKNLEIISWNVDGEIKGESVKIQHSDHHIEIRKDGAEKKLASAHFLKFDAPIPDLQSQNVAVAFEMGFKKQFDQYDPKVTLSEQMQIVKPKKGTVSIFFNAAKEHSGLRFHLHAPFIGDLSRANIKDTKENKPLFRLVAELAAKSLHHIRDVGLLSREFLAVMPNMSDEIDEDYKIIREKIIEEFNEQNLTPVYKNGGHLAAKQLNQGKSLLKDLLNEDDLDFLGAKRTQWTVTPTQQNHPTDRFLQDLDLEEWDMEKVLEKLIDENEHENIDSEPGFEYPDEDVDGMVNYDFVYDPNGDVFPADTSKLHYWMGKKSIAWHQKFYRALLSEDVMDTLKTLSVDIIRLSDVVGSQPAYGREYSTYFPLESGGDDLDIKTVSEEILFEGMNEKEQAQVKQFFVQYGVRNFDLEGEISAILAKRYSGNTDFRNGKFNQETYHRDLTKFISYYRKNTDELGYTWRHSFLFRDRMDKWCSASEIYLDSPYLKTNLSIYYENVRGLDTYLVRTRDGDSNSFKAPRLPHSLSRSYHELGFATDDLVWFLEQIIETPRILPVKKQRIQHDMFSGGLEEWKQLTQDRYSSRVMEATSIDQDFFLPFLEELLAKPSNELSLLIWETCKDIKEDCFTAKYRPNATKRIRTAPSSFRLQLVSFPWIPQGDDKFVKPADAEQHLLPPDFEFDPNWLWLKEIGFGTNTIRRKEKFLQKKEIFSELGIDLDNEEDFEELAVFFRLPRDKRQQFLRNAKEDTFPERAASNPERRAERVRELASEAPDRQTEKRARSVAIGASETRETAKTYLKQQYTDDNQIMVCQICKDRLPFKTNNGNYYFEAIEFLDELKGSKRYYQNYVALCPLHAAMFQHAHESKDFMKNMLVDLEEGVRELEIIMAGEDHSILFTTDHLNDLRALLDENRDDKTSKDDV